MPFYIGVLSLITPVHCMTQTEEPDTIGYLTGWSWILEALCLSGI